MTPIKRSLSEASDSSDLDDNSSNFEPASSPTPMTPKSKSKSPKATPTKSASGSAKKPRTVGTGKSPTKAVMAPNGRSAKSVVASLVIEAGIQALNRADVLQLVSLVNPPRISVDADDTGWHYS
jgi:hypothetical protein